MAETEHTQENISYIRTHVDNIEQMTRFAIASNPDCSDFVRRHLENRKGSAEVYLALEKGPKSLDELVTMTRQSRANVSKICTHLRKQGLLQKLQDRQSKKSQKYSWTDLETLLGVSKIAKECTRP